MFHVFRTFRHHQDASPKLARRPPNLPKKLRRHDGKQFWQLLVYQSIISSLIYAQGTTVHPLCRF
jgi:hypothetical protein